MSPGSASILSVERQAELGALTAPAPRPAGRNRLGSGGAEPLALTQRHCAWQHSLREVADRGVRRTGVHDTIERVDRFISNDI